MVVPRVTLIRLSGALPPWVGAKDVILYLLRDLGVKGGLGRIMEYGGPGAASLSVPERATITNMGAELGAWTSIFPSDEVTRQFLEAQGRESYWAPVAARDGAAYDDVIELNLSSLEPLAACPSSPDAVRPVRDLSGVKVDQVAIGSCTNSSYRDLRMVSLLLKGKRIHPDVSLVISPGSRQVLAMLARNGGLSDMIEAGARVLEVACGPCIGMGQAPPSGGVSVRTYNRNFPGRSGTPDAQVYLCGPQTAVAAALKGYLRDPREMGAPPVVEEPKAFLVDDSMILSPPEDGRDIKVRMGPNIKPLPTLAPLPDEMNLELLLKVGDHITTDDILPGGAKVLPLRSNLPAISEHVYALKAPGFAARAKEHEAVAILGGENYGQGSSREHAALAPRYLGVRMVLAKSFARLHRANLINFGVLPLLIEEEAYQRLEEGDRITLSDLQSSVVISDRVPLKSEKTGFAFEARLDLSIRERQIVLVGGRLNYERGRVSGEV